MLKIENTLFPGRPDYIGPTSGTFGLLHHEVLCESSHDVMERVYYIKNNKPKNEVAVRLHNLIYLGGCEAATDYKAKCAALDAQIIAYIRVHIPDCVWDGKTLVFP